MMINDIEDFLNEKGVKPTSNRLLVMKELVKASHPVSLANLESCLGYSMDKASIFRVLELFSEKDVVHVIEDGSRSFKYELCHGGKSHTAFDQHVHFYCEQCKETYCFESERVPLISIPEGFYPHAVNYVIKGLCPKCSKRCAAHDV
ncbi:MAG: Fur family transcriptional regulator [Candidatus Limimorpha sp.]